jgi:hypothetical protein
MRMIRVFVQTFIIFVHDLDSSIPTGNSTLWHWSGFGDESREDDYYIPYAEVGPFAYETGSYL